MTKFTLDGSGREALECHKANLREGTNWSQMAVSARRHAEEAHAVIQAITIALDELLSRGPGYNDAVRVMEIGLTLKPLLRIAEEKARDADSEIEEIAACMPDFQNVLGQLVAQLDRPRPADEERVS